MPRGLVGLEHYLFRLDVLVFVEENRGQFVVGGDVVGSPGDPAPQALDGRQFLPTRVLGRRFAPAPGGDLAGIGVIQFEGLLDGQRGDGPLGLVVVGPGLLDAVPAGDGIVELAPLSQGHAAGAVHLNVLGVGLQGGLQVEQLTIQEFARYHGRQVFRRLGHGHQGRHVPGIDLQDRQGVPDDLGPVLLGQGLLHSAAGAEFLELAEGTALAVVGVFLLQIAEKALHVGLVSRVSPHALAEQFRGVVVALLFRLLAGDLEGLLQTFLPVWGRGPARDRLFRFFRLLQRLFFVLVGIVFGCHSYVRQGGQVGPADGVASVHPLASGPSSVRSITTCHCNARGQVQQRPRRRQEPPRPAPKAPGCRTPESPGQGAASRKNAVRYHTTTTGYTCCRRVAQLI